MEQPAVDPNALVSHEVDGRILTGVGTTVDDLAETMDRHAEPEPEAPAATPSVPTPQPRDDAGKYKTRGQRRFDELTREREDARREASEVKARAEAAERERDELRARLSAPREPERLSPQAAPVVTPPATRQKPIEDEVGTKYQTYADFAEDLADWKVEQRLAALDLDARIRHGIEADRTTRSHSDRVSGILARGRETYPDFDAVLQAPHMLREWPEDKIAAIAGLDAPEQIQYALGKDPDLAERLRQASPVQFGFELAKLITPQAAASPASSVVGSPVVPAPYQPVGSGSKTTAIPSSELTKFGSDFDRSGYREKRAAERGIRR